MDNPIRMLRNAAGVTQARLAQFGATSQPAVAAYEAGRRSPSVRTLERMARAAGFTLDVRYVPAMTREDRRSLALHEAVAQRLLEDSEWVRSKALANLSKLRALHPGARDRLKQWATLLDLPAEHLAEVLRDRGRYGRALREVSPFAGVLDPVERAEVYRRFRIREATS